MIDGFGPGIVQQSLRLAADGRGRIAVGAPDSNRVEIAAVWPATVTAGDVQVFMVAYDPESGTTLNALAGTLAYNANGAVEVFEIPPTLRQVSCLVNGFVGSGEVIAIASFWRQL